MRPLLAATCFVLLTIAAQAALASPPNALRWTHDELAALAATAPDDTSAQQLERVITGCLDSRSALYEPQGPTPLGHRALQLAANTWTLGRPRPESWPQLPETLTDHPITSGQERLDAARTEGRVLLALLLRAPDLAAGCPPLETMLERAETTADPALRDAYQRYVALYDADALGAGFLDPDTLPAHGVGLDEHHPSVAPLRVRLATEGFLPSANADHPELLDADTLDALHRFLISRALEPTGRFDLAAVEALNAPVELLLSRLEDALSGATDAVQVVHGQLTLRQLDDAPAHAPWITTWDPVRYGAR